MASVVGLSHFFRTVADSNSARLKSLASFLGKSCKNAHGKLEIVLRRKPIASVDENAVIVLVPNPDRSFEGGKSYVTCEFLLHYIYIQFSIHLIIFKLIFYSVFLKCVLNFRYIVIVVLDMPV